MALPNYSLKVGRDVGPYNVESTGPTDKGNRCPTFNTKRGPILENCWAVYGILCTPGRTPGPLFDCKLKMTMMKA